METRNKKSKTEKDISFLDKQGPTFLWYAVYNRNIDVVKDLIAKRENSILAENETPKIQDFPLYLASSYKAKASILVSILKNNNSGYKENTPLNQALFNNSEEIALLLLEAGANPNIPIRIAANPNIPIRIAADPNIPVGWGLCNCLFYAIYHRNDRLVQLLLRYNAEIWPICEVFIGECVYECDRPKCFHYANTRDELQASHNIITTIKYYKNIRKKILLLALMREYCEDSLWGRGLPLDMFRVIIGHLLAADDEFRQIGEERCGGGIMAWLRSFFYGC